MRRDPLPLVVILVLVILGSLAWLTRDPRHPVLERVAEWPLIGPLAESFRRAYQPPPAESPETESEPPPEVVIVDRDVPLPPVAAIESRRQERVWVRAGTELREAPGPNSPVSETLSGIRTMQLVERRGDWRRVSRVGIEGSLSEGWVRATDLRQPSPEELWQPEPVLPLPASGATPETLSMARELMGQDARQLPCGPFRLLTDARGEVVSRCPSLVGQLDGVYAQRTGLEPLGVAAETILLFASDGAYLVFRARISPQSRRPAFASPARGIVALAAGDRVPGQLQATLVHEAVHLLNRRFLGPALPSWLDEGLAEEMAMARIDEAGRIIPDSLSRWEMGPEHRRLIGGGVIQLEALQARLRRGDLPTLESLVRLDRAEFQAEQAFQTHYSLSAFWVRYLLSDPPALNSAGFQEYLAAVAGGTELDDALLMGSLEADWDELEAGFRVWLGTHTAGVAVQGSTR
jgi:hypothetical protein